MEPETFTLIGYWSQVVYDYISCLCDNKEFENISEEKVAKIVEKLLNDDEMWATIDETIDWYLRRIK